MIKNNIVQQKFPPLREIDGLKVIIFHFFLLFLAVPVITMEALVGETVYLPCNVSTHDVGDEVVLVLWYRADKGTPVYR